MHVPIKRFLGARPLSADELLQLQPMELRAGHAALAPLERQKAVRPCPAVMSSSAKDGAHDG